LLASALPTGLPFQHVIIHPLIADQQGRKMSKSLGNVIEPKELIAQYGVDALRLTLLEAASLGTNQIMFDVNRLAFWSTQLSHLIEAGAWLVTATPKCTKVDEVVIEYLSIAQVTSCVMETVGMMLQQFKELLDLYLKSFTLNSLILNSGPENSPVLYTLLNILAPNTAMAVREAHYDC
jgi:valyl-tRNA synthetase